MAAASASSSSPVAPKSYVVEHMEDSDTLPPWVSLEYSHILSVVAPSGSRALFTNLSPVIQDALKKRCGESQQQQKTDFALQESIEDLIKKGTVKKERVCLLDPKAPDVLAPADADHFDVFLFGGILGDDPPRDRTAQLRQHGYAGRHLKEIQMTTDTAVKVSKMVIQDQMPIDTIPFVDHPELKFSAQESVEMPFRYVKDEQGNPIMPEGMREHIRKDLDQAFEF